MWTEPKADVGKLFSHTLPKEGININIKFNPWIF